MTDAREAAAGTVAFAPMRRVLLAVLLLLRHIHRAAAQLMLMLH